MLVRMRECLRSEKLLGDTSWGCRSPGQGGQSREGKGQGNRREGEPPGWSDGEGGGGERKQRGGGLAARTHAQTGSVWCALVVSRAGLPGRNCVRRRAGRVGRGCGGIRERAVAWDVLPSAGRRDVLVILVCGQAEGDACSAPAGLLGKCRPLEKCVGEGLQPQVRQEVLRVWAPAGHPVRVGQVVGVFQRSLRPRNVAKSAVPVYDPR